MKSRAAPSFWQCFDRLPRPVQEAALKQFHLWLDDPSHPSVRFKPLKQVGLWSARVTRNYRAIGYFSDPGEFRWIWIGPHAEYDDFIKTRD